MTLDKLTPEGIGVIFLLLMIVITSYRGDWVWRKVVDEWLGEARRERDEAIRDRDEWKEIAMRGLEVTDRAVHTAAKVVRE